GKVNRKELTLIADVLPMQYELVIKRTLREAQGMLWANLPPASNLPDAQAVKSLRALVRTPQVHQALKRSLSSTLTDEIFASGIQPPETGLAGWGGRTRTQKCRRKISL